MNNKTKVSFALCILMLSTTGCSKLFTKKSSIRKAIETSQQMEQITEEETIPAPKVEIVDADLRDSLLQDAVEIPQEYDGHESIIFSEEQSESIVLPEYKNKEINDISFMLTDMDEDFHYPTDTTSYVTSPYGWRHRRMHAGVDLKVITGDNIYAAFDGVVRIAKYYGGYGYCIVLHHYNGLETLYGHSSKLLVDVNDVVKAGDVIALGGNTGRSTGSHLHFEVRIAGNYINPELVIDTKNHSLQDKNLYISRRSNRIFASNNDSAEDREADIIEELSIKYHIVRSGDVLSRIAVNNHTTVATICRLNNISSTSILRLGQRLIVRDGIRPTTSSTATMATKQTAPIAPKKTTSTSNVSTSTYTVKKGDTLYTIAQRNHTSVSSICSLNNISTRTTLQIGQKLRLKGNAVASTQKAATIHTVRSGDTLSQIAARYHTTVRAICQLNNITTRTTLQIGQKLRIA